MLGPWLAQPPGSQPDPGVPDATTTSSLSTAIAVPEPVFTCQEQLALAGFLVGYTGLTREAYALDLRQYAGLVPAAASAPVPGAAGGHRVLRP